MKPTNALGWTAPKPMLINECTSVGKFLFLSPVMPVAKKIVAVMIVARALSKSTTERGLTLQVAYKPTHKLHLFQLTAYSHRGCLNWYICAVGVRQISSLLAICYFDTRLIPRVVLSGSCKKEQIASPILTSGRSSGVE